MSDTKFTPGPWSTHREGYSTVYVDAPIGGGVLQEVAACGPTAGGQEQQDANALLISAAPDLYAALVLLMAEVDFSGNGTAKDFGWPRATEAARAAIAKARGES